MSLALLIAPMQVSLLALGDITVTLTCSDGTDITDTILVVDAPTLSALQSAVDAMTLYPAGLVCRITQQLTGSLLGGLFAPSPAFAQADPNNPNKDFVVAGGRIARCLNFGVSAHSDPANTFGTSKGSVTNNIPQASAISPCIPRPDQVFTEPGGFNAEVVCLFVSDNVARVTANIRQAHGSAFDGVGAVQAAFQDNGNPGPLGPVDWVIFAYQTTPVLIAVPPCNLLVPTSDNLISNGNVVVNDAP